MAMPGFGIISHKSEELRIIGSGPYVFQEVTKGKSCLQKFNTYKFESTDIDSFFLE